MSEPPTIPERVQTALHLSRAVRLVWRAAPGWTLANVVLVFFQGLLPLVSLYLMKRIVDAATEGLAAPEPGNAFQAVAFWVVLAGSVAVITAMVRSLGEYVSEAQALQVTDAVADVLHAQSLAVDLAYYEDPAYYDTLHRAQREAPYRPTRIVNGLVQIAQNAISLLGITGLLFTFNWLVALVLFAAALPGAVLRLLHSRRLYVFEQAQTENERLAWYYHDIITDGQQAKEIRLFGIGALFRERYRGLLQDIRAGRLGLLRRRITSDVLAQVAATVALFASLAWIAGLAVQGTLSIGDMVIFYMAFQSGLGYFQSVLRGLSGLYEDNLFLGNLVQFLDLTPDIVSPAQPRPVPQPMPQPVAVRGLTFRYPSRQEDALCGIDLDVAPGEVVALVGENGSGKTTLIKLLCRLYDPVKGSVSVGGVDLREMDPVAWRRQLSVVFQDYARYALTAWENIWLGDVDSPAERGGIQQAALRSGADAAIGHLPDGYDTVLGRWFRDGQELSVGEWQKVALARAFWRKSRLVILDEPTSSLDPLAESELFNGIRGLLDGRSAILISHRFSTVQLADRIYVLDHGRVVEHGSHAQLMAAGGRYAALYRAQAQRYQQQ